jgi:hypothetical protein
MPKLSPSDNNPVLNANLKVGGITPSIIHELSGVYSNFTRAFKEIISNSYDADATDVIIEFADDFEWVTIQDNGVGMTPLEFQNDYLRIGNDPEKRDSDQTPSGRPRIGRKGIGFLSLARYCKSAEILTHSEKKIQLSKTISLSDLDFGKIEHYKVDLFKDKFDSSLFSFSSVDAVFLDKLKLAKHDYKIADGILLITGLREDGKDDKRKSGKLTLYGNHQRLNRELLVKYSVDCSKIDLLGMMDYEYLLGINGNKNLFKIEEFSKVILYPINHEKSHCTRIKLYLQDYIRRDLQASKRIGRVRNIASSSGFEKFIWNLRRSTPINYDTPNEILISKGMNYLANNESSLPFNIQVIHQKYEINTHLTRPFIGEITKYSLGDPLVCHPIAISSDGLIARGYLLGFNSPVFPGEMRGISIRVRGVEIGSPGFLGIENELPLKYRSILDHLVGEIYVSDGLDAIHTIMAGREGFYVEDKYYQLLKKYLVGVIGTDYGVLGIVIRQLIEYKSVEASAERILQEATQRRDAFLFISNALDNIIVGAVYGTALRKLFSRKDIISNHLTKLPTHNIRIRETNGKYDVELSSTISLDYVLDLTNKKIYLNKDSDIWNSTIYILGRNFIILLKDGKAYDPPCEIDFSEDKIYINWLHPTRSKIGDANFLKTALAWRIAYMAAESDVDIMMNLALRILSFSQ